MVKALNRSEVSTLNGAVQDVAPAGAKPLVLGSTDASAIVVVGAAGERNNKISDFQSSSAAAAPQCRQPK